MYILLYFIIHLISIFFFLFWGWVEMLFRESVVLKKISCLEIFTQGTYSLRKSERSDVLFSSGSCYQITINITKTEVKKIYLSDKTIRYKDSGITTSH